MRVLIVGDEALARTALANVLSMRSDVEGFESASDAAEALDKMGRDSYDAVLLDVSLDGVSGLELLERIRGAHRQVPAIVFVTAHQPDAIKALELQADDVVLKPFITERIDKALNVVSRRAANERAARLLEILSQVGGLSQQQSARIAIKSKGRIRFINPKDVIMVQAQGNYVLLQRDSESHLLRESISVLAEKLRTYGFIRIHKSVLVNRSCVEEIYHLQAGMYGLRLKGGRELTVTRTYRRNLESVADYWIDSFPGLCDRKNGSARNEFLAQEKQLIRLRDEVNRERRELPQGNSEKDYVFPGTREH
jgi:two-component system LytT family response regulator